MAIRMGRGGRCEFVDGVNALYRTDTDDVRLWKVETLRRCLCVRVKGGNISR